MIVFVKWNLINKNCIYSMKIASERNKIRD